MSNCPLKTIWQEWQCLDNHQCDKVSGDTTCDNPFDAPCDYQIQLKNKTFKSKTTKPMKLKIYDNSQDNLNRQGKSTVALSSKSGTISFSQSCCQAVGISAGSKIALAQDETNPKDWYLIPFTGEEEHFFVFSPANGKGKEKQNSIKKVNFNHFQKFEFYGGDLQSARCHRPHRERRQRNLCYFDKIRKSVMHLLNHKTTNGI